MKFSEVYGRATNICTVLKGWKIDRLPCTFANITRENCILLWACLHHQHLYIYKNFYVITTHYNFSNPYSSNFHYHNMTCWLQLVLHCMWIEWNQHLWISKCFWVWKHIHIHGLNVYLYVCVYVMLLHILNDDSCDWLLKLMTVHSPWLIQVLRENRHTHTHTYRLTEFLCSGIIINLVVGLMAWSSNSQYIYTRDDTMSTTLWIWDMQQLQLAAILLQKDSIKAAAWDPTSCRLAFCTGSSHLYMWTPSGAYCVSIPLPHFNISDLKWNSDGTYLLLKDKESFCCAAVPILAESSEDYSSDEWFTKWNLNG